MLSVRFTPVVLAIALAVMPAALIVRQAAQSVVTA